MEQSVTKNKNLQINGYRTILLIFVMLYHFLIVFSKENVAGFHIAYNFIPGQAATCVFLVLSGWFLSIKTIGLFWYKKFFKIILPFIVSVLIVLLVRIFFGNFYISGTDIAMNVLILPMNSNLFAYIDGAHWYIAVLIYFFVIYTIIFLFEKIVKKDFSFWFYLALLALCLIITIFIKPSNMFFKILRCLFPPHFVFIISGLLLSKIDRKYFKNNTVSILFVVIIVLASCLTCLFHFDWYQLIFFGVLIISLVFCHYHKIKFLEYKIFQVVGNASLWIYLLHQEIGYLIIKPFFENSLYWLGVFVAFASMLLVGMCASFIWKRLVLLNLFKK